MRLQTGLLPLPCCRLHSGCAAPWTERQNRARTGISDVTHYTCSAQQKALMTRACSLTSCPGAVMIPQVDRTQIPNHPGLHRGRVLATKVENRVDQVLKGHAFGNASCASVLGTPHYGLTYLTFLPRTVALQYPGRSRMCSSRCSFPFCSCPHR